MGAVADNIARVRERICDSALRAGRTPDEVRLVAVTKTVGLAAIREAIAAGVDCCGENYVQEAREKVGALGAAVEWHMVGRLQSNKAKHAVALFSMVHSIDSLDLAKTLGRYAVAAGRTLEILIQVNIAGEVAKAGISANEVEPLIEQVSLLKGVRINGLMTMPPLFLDPEQARPFFRTLKKLRDRLQRTCGVYLKHLSMGMSADFEIAIEEGATLVRIGTAIFGVRS